MILKLSQKHKGPSRSLHVVLNENPILLEEYLNGELGQPKIYRAKIKLVKESFKLSLLLFRLHTNTVENHSQDTPGLLKILGRTLFKEKKKKKL